MHFSAKFWTSSKNAFLGRSSLLEEVEKEDEPAQHRGRIIAMGRIPARTTGMTFLITAPGFKDYETRYEVYRG